MLSIRYDSALILGNTFDSHQTVLHVLTIGGHSYKWIRLLLMRCCDPCSQDIDGYTAAHYAVERDDLGTLQALTMRFSSTVKPFPGHPMLAIHERGLQALSLITPHGLTVFMLACHCESLKCLRYLLELNINDADRQVDPLAVVNDPMPVVLPSSRTVRVTRVCIMQWRVEVSF